MPAATKFLPFTHANGDKRGGGGGGGRVFPIMPLDAQCIHTGASISITSQQPT